MRSYLTQGKIMVTVMCDLIQPNSYFHGSTKGKKVPLNCIWEGVIHPAAIGLYLSTTYPQKRVEKENSQRAPMI